MTAGETLIILEYLKVNHDVKIYDSYGHKYIKFSFSYKSIWKLMVNCCAIDCE